MNEKCEVCNKEIFGEMIEHVAGFPERNHIICSNRCLTQLLRMEDDELEFRNSINLKNGNKKKNRR